MPYKYTGYFPQEAVAPYMRYYLLKYFCSRISEYGFVNYFCNEYPQDARLLNVLGLQLVWDANAFSGIFLGNLPDDDYKSLNLRLVSYCS